MERTFQVAFVSEIRFLTTNKILMHLCVIVGVSSSFLRLHLYNFWAFIFTPSVRVKLSGVLFFEKMIYMGSNIS